ncbi:hypothetical protein HYDPIDRAFT_77493 [Hydnomerulius pinastri MD-312]|nr:hypothetical protein HYDPIDRAFT_77493 [Hydnomerulius pinastri MD-312]
MESPPPSFSGAVDDVERQLELSYPEPEAVVLTPTSLKAPSQEASEGASSSKLPLFLPSPSISPVVSDHSPATGPPETDDEVIIVEDNVKPSLKRRSTEVESMAGDASISPPRVRKRRKQQVYVLVPPPPSPVQKIIERMKMKERAIADDLILSPVRYNHLEQVVIEESKSRLMERRCRWLNCEAILNCGHNLLAHLKVHADEDSSQAPFRCHWTGCRRKFRTSDERDVHLGRHTIFPLPCPFAGCDEEFGMPIEVMHHEVQHQNQGHRRPLLHKLTSKPFVPSIPARLGRPPLRLPSSCVLPRRVLRARISADRHAVMGPWVLWNIFSPVDLNMRKQNATMRGGPTRQGGDNDAKGPDSRRDEYDFLLPLSPYPSKIPPLDDLNSGLVTALASRGLTLWGPETPLNSLDEPARPAESLARNDEPVPSAADTAMSDSTTDALMMVEGKATVTDLVAPSAPKDIATEEPQSAQSMGTAGEEEAVERMLVL